MRSSRSTVRRVLGAAAIGVLALATTACTASESPGGGEAPANAECRSDDAAWQKIVATAEEQGSFSLYSVAAPQQNDRLIEAFNECYPEITVNVTRGAGELPARVEAEIAGKQQGADVFLYTEPWFITNGGALLELDSPSVENWPEEFWSYPATAPTASITPWSIIVWNTQTFPDGFEGFDDLLDEANHGKIGLTMAPPLAAVHSGYLAFLERNFGTEYLEALGELEPKMYPSNVPMAQAIASGEVGVAGMSTPVLVLDLKEQGAPVDWVVTDPAFGFSYAAGVLAHSERSEAGQVFLDFFMSPAGQFAFNGDGLGSSALSGIDGAVDVSTVQILDPREYTPDVLDEWQRKFDQYFG